MADHPNPSMLETAIGWALGGGGLVALGGGIKWLWDKIANARASREARIEERETDYVTKIEARLSMLEKKIEHQDVKIEHQERELANHRSAIALLVAEVARTNPSAAVLHQVGQLLGSSFPFSIQMPPDITDLAQQIE